MPEPLPKASRFLTLRIAERATQYLLVRTAHLVCSNPRFTDEMAQIEANADYLTTQQQKRIQEVRTS